MGGALGLCFFATLVPLARIPQDSFVHSAGHYPHAAGCPAILGSSADGSSASTVCERLADEFQKPILVAACRNLNVTPARPCSHWPLQVRCRHSCGRVRGRLPPLLPSPILGAEAGKLATFPSNPSF